MKKLLFLGLLLSATTTFSQPNTEVYLLDLKEVEGKIEFSNLRNISNNEGYDNQPSFYDNHNILFASTRNGQTDIAGYNIASGESSWLTDTPAGSEYSPLRIPKSDQISAIRLADTGYQRLYRYDTSNGTSNEILKDLKVGYHSWHTDAILVTTILVKDRMDLVISHLKDGTNYTTQKNVGRALQKIPNTELISYVSKEDETWYIKSLHPSTGATTSITPLPPNTEDFCWLPDGSLLIPVGKAIYSLNPEKDERPEVLHHFNKKEVNEISRMAVSSDGKHLAIVSTASPAIIVQKQVASFNSQNLDAFAACYAENVVVRNFPNDTLYVGNKTLKANYKHYFDTSPKTTVEVVKRIQIGDVVIDEELVYRSGRTNRQVAIYEVTNGKIASMTFIHENEPLANVDQIVNNQLEAYNTRDIETFLTTFADDVKLYQYPNKLTDEGQDALRNGYEDFFERTPDLNCEIKNRISIGNKVIDEEYLTMNGTNLSAVAIYEIANGTISKVTFIQ